MSRVVVTGLGLITSLGNDLATNWEALTQGRSGVGKITAYDTSDFRVHIGAEIKDFDPSLYMDRKEAKRGTLRPEAALLPSSDSFAACPLFTESNAIKSKAMGHKRFIRV